MDLKSFGIFSSIASYFADVYMDDGVILFYIEGKCGRSVLGMERLEKLMSEYLEYCRQRKNLNGKTLKAYRIDLTQYAGFIESIGGDGLQRHSIDTYITEIHKHYKPRTIKRKTASLKAFFHYLVSVSYTHLTLPTIRLV